MRLVLLSVLAGCFLCQDSGSAQGSRSRRVNPYQVIASTIIAEADRNQDDALDRNELEAWSTAWFSRLNPDQTPTLSREDFLRRFDALLPAPRASRFRSVLSSGPTRHVSVFLALDKNADTELTASEWHQRWLTWFEEWKSPETETLSLTAFTEGLQAAMPRTNLTGAFGNQDQVRLPGLPTPPPSPILSPEDSMATIQLDPDFHLELMATEPILQDPISFTFDANGRIYVLEMRNYMLDLERSGENDPIARITLLEDRDRNGSYETHTIFLDKLVNPRTISASRGGVFYVADGKLYFAADQNHDGQADLNELVDPNYGGGNIEHAPNGMMPALDNWIYNARSPWRYRWVGKQLIKQATENRGQWGITQDNYGRLLFNVNNSQLLCDYTPPNTLGRNPNFTATAGLNLFVSTDQRVFSIRMNTGINRGYSPDVLDAEGKAYVFASSCGPVIYRGDNFPRGFVGNAFVCDPALNLIKRNLVYDTDLTLRSEFAYPDREFIASTDERFRPVNAFNAPDGTLWFVDLYRGVAQYGIFMTDYLRKETLERQLQQGIHLGRLYRVVANDKKPALPPLLANANSQTLVNQLGVPNGWTRDAAQRLLVERQDFDAVPALQNVLRSDANELHKIHALWTLEGLFSQLRNPSESIQEFNYLDHPLISPNLPDSVLNDCLQQLAVNNPELQVAAIRVLDRLTLGFPERQTRFLDALDNIAGTAQAEVLFHTALAAGNLPRPQVFPLLTQIVNRGVSHLIIREAIMSSLFEWELAFVQYLLSDPSWQKQRPGGTAMLEALASAVIKEADATKVGLLLSLAANQSSNQQRWRQLGLLSGIQFHARGQNTKKIRFDRKPVSLTALEQHPHPEVVKLVQQATRIFTWSGLEDDSAPQRESSPQSPTKEQAELIAEGKALFQQVCAGCHGLDGAGLKPLAPPLKASEWVSGSPQRLTAILLKGLAGPIDVNGQRYAPPNILPEMPGLEILDDHQLTAVLTYLQSEWGQQISVTESSVSELRAEFSDRGLPWTQAELLELD